MKLHLDMDKIAKGLGVVSQGKVTARSGYFGAMQLAADTQARFKSVPKEFDPSQSPQFDYQRNIIKKPDIVSAISAKSNSKKEDVERFLDALIKTVEENLNQGKKVRLASFGTFEVRRRSEREVRNPRTGVKIRVNERNVPVFKAGRAFKEAVK